MLSVELRNPAFLTEIKAGRVANEAPVEPADLKQEESAMIAGMISDKYNALNIHNHFVSCLKKLQRSISKQEIFLLADAPLQRYSANLETKHNGNDF